MRTSSGPELMSHISPPPTQHQLQPTPSSNLHPIFIILPHPNNNMTRTGAKHTSKDNETHALPQKSVSTTSCDSLLWEREQENRRTREQEKKRARKTETEREGKKVRHMWMQLYSGVNHMLYVSSCLLSGSFFLGPLSLSSLFWPSLFWQGSTVPKISLRCAEVREK